MAYVSHAIPPQPVAVTQTMQAPVLGLMTHLPEDNMPPTAAVDIVNWISDGAKLYVRNGTEQHADTATGTAVETIAQWLYGGSTKLLAASGGNIWDVTTSTPASLGSGFTSNRWQWASFNLVTQFVNGADAPQSYDGTTLAAAGWTGTGLNPNDLIDVHPYKERLYFVEKDSLNFWYGASKAITGALTKFPLETIAEEAGTLASITTFSSDTGSGPDDFIVFVTSKGELIVYTGNDPGSNFALVGIWKTDRPIGGPRCTGQIANAEAVIMTETGYYTIGEIVRGVPISERVGVPIANLVHNAHVSYEGVFGWQVVDFPHGNFSFMNVPNDVGGTNYIQHVRHRHGPWTTFGGWDARCFLNYEDVLYMGMLDGTVRKSNDSFNDAGTNIEATAKPSFQYFQSPTRLKRFQLVRPTVRSEGAIPLGIDFDVDFADGAASYTTSPVTSTTTPWGSAWGSAWGKSTILQRDWRAVRGEGYCGTMRLSISTSVQPVEWTSWDCNFQVGGTL